ncbi:GDYXXLXY domain-containing protein [Desmospora profundinema]|uniref:Membrane-anchored protein n=1 Tax=Desmospora profundinema TaxID=1571184 RepID=A0ABU1IP72_9BACL|nr:GDYXXLXY domain-containing protein [Desmospora profundinema]MDR6226327.1 putative membrane-anchored protein [Desmospora profundinema]
MRRKPFIFIIIAQVLVLVGLALGHTAVGWFGKEIRLETKPVDPRDWLYGDYVALFYDIHEVPFDRWQGEGEPDGDPVYVVLEPQGEVHIVKEVVPQRPRTEPGEVFLKARARTEWLYDEEERETKSLTLTYGLERYYVPEGTGTAWEAPEKTPVVHLKVAPWGQGKIERLEPGP